MPRYFFHLNDGTTKLDADGVELAGRREAWNMATRTVGEIIRDMDAQQRPGGGWSLEVVEEGGQRCWTLRFETEAFVPDP